MSDDYDDELFNAYNEASDAKPPMDQQDNFDEEFADALDTAVTDNASDIDSSGMDVDRQRQQQQNRPQTYNSTNQQQQQQRYYQQPQQQQPQAQQQQPNGMMGGMPMSYNMALMYQQQMQQYMAANPLQFQMMQQQFRQMQQQQQQQQYQQQQRRPYQQQAYQRQGNNDEQSSEGKMFIGGLNWDTTDDGLKDYFSKFGEVASCTVMRDPTTGQSRGFGFLTMVNPDDVEQVLKENEHHLDGKKIDPKRAVSRSEQAQQQQSPNNQSQPERSEKIFVGGISSEVDQDEFRAFFERFGTVAEATLMMDRETGRPRGFGFITFDEAASVERALEATDLVIKDRQVEIKRAMPKTKRTPTTTRPNSRYAGAATAMNGMMYGGAHNANPYATMAAYYSRMNNGGGNFNNYPQQQQQDYAKQEDGDDEGGHDDRRRHHSSRDRDHHSRRNRDSSRDDRYHRSSSRQPYDDRTGGGAVHASSSSRNQSSYRPY